MSRTTYPLISVVIPVYNIESYIANSIESIQNQTYSNLEIILVDDGSTDSSKEVCRKYSEKDERVICLSKENGGPSSARNEGIDFANGEYLFFVDGDDYIAPKTLETLYRRVVTDHSEMALCGVTRVGKDHRILRTFETSDDVITGFQALKMAYREDNGVLFCSMIVNKLYHHSLFAHIRFPNGKFHEDEATVYKLLDQCSLISLVSDPLYYYLDREDSTMNKPYSVKQLDGIEACYQRYFYYKEKGGQYKQLLIPEGDRFTPLFFQSKQRFIPNTEMEKKRVQEIDKMAREICLDRFFSWSLPRKVKLLSPYMYLQLGHIKKAAKRGLKSAPHKIKQASQRFQTNKRQFGTGIAICSFTNVLLDGYSNLYIQAFSEYMRRDLSDIIQKYQSGNGTAFKGKAQLKGKKPIWTCWLQGEKEMPPMVKACLSRNRAVLTSDDLVFLLIDEENVKDYIDLPPYITRKYEEGLISKAWYSDILRWGLLATYGGTWLDTTFYLTRDSADDYNDLLHFPFYTQRFQTPEDAPHEPSRGKWCNGLLSGEKNSIIFPFVYESLLYFWKKYDYPADYVFLDYIVWAGYSSIPEIKELIDNVPANNIGFWDMVSKMNEPYDVIRFQNDMRANELYKFPYRGNLMTATEDGRITNYGHILESNGISSNKAE